MEHDVDWARQAQRGLRELLNAWDPIGVFVPSEEDEVPSLTDEYDCIRDQLLSHLLRGDGPDDVADFLRNEITEHFGLDSSLVTTTLVDHIFEWWASVEQRGHRGSSKL